MTTNHTPTPYDERKAARIAAEAEGKPQGMTLRDWGVTLANREIRRKADAHDALTARVAELEAALRTIRDAYGFGPLAMQETARQALGKGQA